MCCKRRQHDHIQKHTKDDELSAALENELIVEVDFSFIDELLL